MKLSDVFAKYIKSIGVNAVFGLQGGAVVHFFDSLEKIRKTKGPLICEIFTSSNQAPLFKQGYKKMHSNKYEPQPLSEMYPFIDKSSKPISNTNN